MAHMLDTVPNEHLSMSRLLDLLEEQIEAFEDGLSADYQLMNEIIEYFLTFPDLQVLQQARLDGWCSPQISARPASAKASAKIARCLSIADSMLDPSWRTG